MANIYDVLAELNVNNKKIYAHPNINTATLEIPTEDFKKLLNIPATHLSLSPYKKHWADAAHRPHCCISLLLKPAVAWEATYGRAQQAYNSA